MLPVLVRIVVPVPLWLSCRGPPTPSLIEPEIVVVSAELTATVPASPPAVFVMLFESRLPLTLTRLRVLPPLMLIFPLPAAAAETPVPIWRVVVGPLMVVPPA